MDHLLQPALDLARHHTGVVLPVYLPNNEEFEASGKLLHDTVCSLTNSIAEPTWICLAVDGVENGADTARELGAELGISVAIEEENRGKLQGMLSGARVLLEHSDIRYLAVLDQDGDHFANELPNFVRAAEHMCYYPDVDGVLVNGSRSSRHRPMGFLRGELEELADRILLDMLQFRAAARKTPMDLRFAGVTEAFPDFHSGYKLYSRNTAEQVFGGEPDCCKGDADACYRHGCEAFCVVEALESGATFGQIDRSTFNKQPVSTFGSLDVVHLVADKILWPAQRLEIPAVFVRQWMLNAMPHLRLQTLAPEGADILGKIFQRVMTSLDPHGDHQLPGDTLPLFV